jgi:hypothetical protein
MWYMYVSAGQLHCEGLVDPAGEVAPEGHDLQEDPSLYVLAGQLQSDQMVDPAEEVVPSGHDLQDMDGTGCFSSICCLNWYVLAGQLQLNKLFDPAEEVVRKGHDLQELEDPSLYVLGGHLQES